MRYFVSIGELGEKIDFLEKQLSIIDKNIDKLEQIKSTIVWDGYASMKFRENFDDYLKELISMESRILSYIEYLMKFYHNYSYGFIRMRQKYIELSNRGMDLWD